MKISIKPILCYTGLYKNDELICIMPTRASAVDYANFLIRQELVKKMSLINDKSVLRLRGKVKTALTQ